MNKVQICNAALIALGANVIMSISQNTEEARVCNAAFDMVLDEVLASHVWGCALEKASLAQNTTTPLFGYAYSYALPINPYCLRVVKLYEEEAYGYKWKIVGRTLETDSATATIEYIKRVTDLNALSPLLANAVSARLAAEIAYRLTANAAMRETMWQLYTGKLAEAKQMDALEGREIIDQTSSWITARGESSDNDLIYMDTND